MSRRCDKSLHQPHMLYFWTVQKHPHRQQHQVQKQKKDVEFKWTPECIPLKSK